ncbi:hypothetical protein PC115_g2967 [Phytophthora cactorum]|uniref:Uncharacterized protein n=1 Tax=Phytophthora cactorum TaxID=29920 RepID=A0A8T1DF96_9STRA|nr:hypothetical protein PC115_g2967 [Phytophthora cactorum]
MAARLNLRHPSSQTTSVAFGPETITRLLESIQRLHCNAAICHRAGQLIDDSGSAHLRSQGTRWLTDRVTRLIEVSAAADLTPQRPAAFHSTSLSL